MTSLGLLVFTRNDPDAALEIFKMLKGRLSEAVFVDSSNPDIFAAASARPTDSRIRWVRVLPVGYAELLWAYGFGQIQSDWTLHLDTDERPSLALLESFPELSDGDAFVVPRLEKDLNSYTFLLRLWRTRSVTLSEDSYGSPRVPGPIRTLAPPQCIEHYADHRKYLEAGGRGDRYLLVESYERPFDQRFLAEVLTIRLRRRELRFPLPKGPEGPGSGDPLPRVAARLTVLVRAVRELLVTGSSRWARFSYRYDRARFEYCFGLPPAERSRRAAITHQLREAGGLLRYLGFDERSYVDQLTASFRWDRLPIEVLDGLLNFRFVRGRRAATIAELGPPRSDHGG